MAELTGIESKLFTARDFRLENGQSLPVLELAYETYGTLNAAKDNGVLVVHGYTTSHRATGPNATDPKDKKPYGPTFPEITMRDIVASQKLLVDSLGLKSLVAVIGP